LFSQFYRVPYCVPAWGLSEHWAILKCLVSGRVIVGPDKAKLCSRMREVTGVRYVYGFNSGREAIRAALQGFGLFKGDSVIMPSYCCESVAKAVVDCGANPVFCDIGEDYNPDIGSVLSLIGPTTRAIIFTHLFGNPGRIDLLERSLEGMNIRSQILLVDDAAQSFGARLGGRLVGTFGDVGIISFGPGKTMSATGGGLLITNSEGLAESVCNLSIRQIEVTAKLKKLFYWLLFRRWRKYTLPFYRFVEKRLGNIAPTGKALEELCNVDASILMEQTNRLERLLKLRTRRKDILDGLLAHDRGSDIEILPRNGVYEGFLNVATKYPVRLRKVPPHFDLFGHYRSLSHLTGIEVQPLYTPIHMKAPYGGTKGALPRTEKYWNTTIHIPMEPSTIDKDFLTTARMFMTFMNRWSHRQEEPQAKKTPGN
jgi:perosamine synthetase